MNRTVRRELFIPFTGFAPFTIWEEAFMHRAASRFAIAVQDAGVTGDSKPVFTGLADLTAQCVGCHAGYRLQ